MGRKAEDGMTYIVGAAMRTQVGGQRNSSAEAEQHAQSIHGDVDNRDAELLDEGCWQEVEQREEPPYTHEERVVDDGGHAVVGARDVVAHEGCDEDCAEELGRVRRNSFFSTKSHER
jgi:hypothetical protein